MKPQLNHLVVWATDRRAAAEHFADVVGSGPFPCGLFRLRCAGRMFARLGSSRRRQDIRKLGECEVLEPRVDLDVVELSVLGEQHHAADSTGRQRRRFPHRCRRSTHLARSRRDRSQLRRSRSRTSDERSLACRSMTSFPERAVAEDQE